MSFTISCVDCRTPVAPDDGRALCEGCGGLLDYAYDLAGVRFDDVRSIWRYRDLLPVASDVEPVSIGEGLTPLVRATIDLGTETWWKNELLNPSGSQKDRAMSVALTRARAVGIDAVFVASAGSTALAAAAYAARAGICCIVLVGEEASERRLLPIAAYGARIFRVRGSVDDALDLLDRAVRTIGLHDVSTRRAGNPAQGEGPKTIAYEILEALGRDTGLGGRPGRRRRHPRLDPSRICRAPGDGPQRPRAAARLVPADRLRHVPAGARARLGQRCRPPIERVRRTAADGPGQDRPHVRARRRGSPRRDSRSPAGRRISVSDEEALQGVRQLAGVEGIFAEPSSGGVVAAIRRLTARGLVRRDDVVVGLVGGSGFRELDAIEASMSSRAEFLPDGDPIDFLASLR